MIEGWSLWLLLVGFAAGVAVTAVLLWRLPRRDDDVGAAERRVEAGWIAGTIERGGGVAPESFVEEVLDLHAAYLESWQVPGPPRGTAPPPLAPPPGLPPPGYLAPEYAPPPGYDPRSGQVVGRGPNVPPPGPAGPAGPPR